MTVGATSSMGIRFNLDHKAYGKYYHKHTKNVSMNELKHNLEKGIKVFEDKVKSYFDELVHQSVTPQQALVFLQQCKDEGVIADKYLDQMTEVIQNKSRFPSLKSKEVTNAFRLFTLMAEVIQTETSSIDTQDRYLKLLAERMSKIA
jgi:hypothetical protein